MAARLLPGTPRRTQHQHQHAFLTRLFEPQLGIRKCLVLCTSQRLNPMSCNKLY